MSPDCFSLTGCGLMNAGRHYYYTSIRMYPCRVYNITHFHLDRLIASVSRAAMIHTKKSYNIKYIPLKQNNTTITFKGVAKRIKYKPVLIIVTMYS